MGENRAQTIHPVAIYTVYLNTNRLKKLIVLCQCLLPLLHDFLAFRLLEYELREMGECEWLKPPKNMYIESNRSVFVGHLFHDANQHQQIKIDSEIIASQSSNLSTLIWSSSRAVWRTLQCLLRFLITASAKSGDLYLSPGCMLIIENKCQKLNHFKASKLSFEKKCICNGCSK